MLDFLSKYYYENVVIQIVKLLVYLHFTCIFSKCKTVHAYTKLSIILPTILYYAHDITLQK